MGMREVMVMTVQTNHPGIARAWSRRTALSPALATVWTWTLKILGEGMDSEESRRTAFPKNSVSTGPGQRVVTETPVPRSSPRSASEKLLT